MSEDFVELMERKFQINHRQGNLSGSRDSNTNKVVTDWKRDGYNGKILGNDKKYNQSRSFIGCEDRRHRQRGCFGKCQKEEMKKGSTLESESEEPEESSVVSDSLRKRGRRPKNLNHMLDFYFQLENQVKGPGSKNRQKHIGSKKERFLQANCQFVVKPDKDYKQHSIDPDLLIDWEHVLQVRLFAHELPSCPICLELPRAAKITKCGHVYCWPCMLHYLSVSSESCTWSKCPICCEPVSEKDLKSVCIVRLTKHLPGTVIKMKLMSKIRGDSAVNPRNSVCTTKGDDGIHSVRDAEGSVFARLLAADGDFMRTMALMEMSELEEMMLESDLDTLESSFITSAIEKNEKFMSQEDFEATPKKTISFTCMPIEEDPMASVITHTRVVPGSVKTYSSAFDDEIVGNCPSNPVEAADQRAECNSKARADVADVGLALCGLELLASRVKESPVKKMKYFYQAADGQHVYMHSLNVRCLTSEYATLERCPDEVEAVVVDVEEHSMSEENVSQFSYLDHLPISCQFKVVELDLRPPLVSKESLRVVEEVVRRRRREREVRDRRDKRNAIEIQRMENKLLGYDPDTKIISSDYHKIQEEGIGQSSFDASYHFPGLEGPSMGAEVKFVSVDKDKTNLNGDQSGLSFAQMLRSGKAKSAAKPTFSCQWNTAAASKDCNKQAADEEEEAGEVPDFSASWNADVTKKLDETLLKAKQDAPPKGKKKKKGILLFATGAVGPNYR